MSRKIFGLDIRNHAVSAVLVTGSLRENRVDAHAYIPISDPEDMQNGIPAALETLTETIDLSGSDCVVSIPAYQFIYRNLQIPFGNPKKIRLVLPFELEPTLPYAVENLIFDFYNLDTTGMSDQPKIIAAAVEKTRIDFYIKILASCKIDPETVTISGLPLALCLANQADPGEYQLLIEIDNEQTTLFVAVAGQIQLIRSFPSPALKSSRSETICTHIRRTLAAFEEMTQLDFNPLEVVVTGNSLDEVNLVEDIARMLEVSVKPANLVDRLNIPVESDSENSWDSAQMDNALALALVEIEGLSGLNFYKGQFAAQKFISKHKSNLVKTGILAAAVLALIFFNGLFESYTLKKKLSRFDQQITQIFKTTFPDVKKIVDPFQQMKIELQEAQKNSIYQTEQGPQIRSIDILNSISERIPKEIAVDLTRLVIQPKNVLISGTTDTFNSVDEIKGRLEQIKFFEKVTINSANIDRSGKEVRFMLKVEL